MFVRGHRVALYEFRDAGLIAVDVNYCRVTATSAGLATMAQWNSQRVKAT